MRVMERRESPPYEGNAEALRDALGMPATAELPPIEAKLFQWAEPSSIRPRPWVYGRHYMRGMVSATAGIGGAGKTSLLIVEALSIATGLDLMNGRRHIQVGPLPVWLHNGEDPIDELQRRVVAACLAHNIKPDMIGERLYLTSGRDTPIMVAQELDGSKVMVPTEDGKQLTAEISKRGIHVFIADPFVSMHRVSENDNVMIDAVMGILRNIANDTFCAVELAHHFRKLNGQEPSVDDVRGASSIVGACRSVRVVAQMTKEEAELLGIDPDERKGYAWLQNGKANMLPPTLARHWMQLQSVDLDNACEPYQSDSVGVVVQWNPPARAYDLTPEEYRAVRLVFKEAPQPLNNLRVDIRSTAWAGRAIGAALEMDTSDKAVKIKVTQLLTSWTAKNVIRIEMMKDPRQGRVAQVYQWVERDEL